MQGKYYPPINVWRIPKPNKDLVREYEKIKGEYNDSLYYRLEEMTNKKEKKEKYAQHCDKCKYTWICQVEKPKRCPNCNKRVKFPTEIDLLAQKTGGVTPKVPFNSDYRIPLEQSI